MKIKVFKKRHNEIPKINKKRDKKPYLDIQQYI